MKTLISALILGGSLVLGGCGDKEEIDNKDHSKKEIIGTIIAEHDSSKIKWDKELFKEFKDWSHFDENMSNGRYVTYSRGTTEEKSSDLYIFDTEKEVGWKVTNTPNENECGAQIFGDYVAFFSDYKSEYSNKKLRQIKIVNYKTGEMDLVGKPKEYKEVENKKIVFRNNGKTIELVNEENYSNIHKNPFDKK